MLAFHFPPENSSSVFRTLYMSKHLFEKTRWQPVILTIAPKNLTEGYVYDDLLLQQINQKMCVFRTSYTELRASVLRLKHNRKHKLLANAKKKHTAENIYPVFTAPPPYGNVISFWQSIKDFLTDELLAFPDRHMGWIPNAVITGVKQAKRKQIDIIYSTGGPWSSHVAAYLIKQATGLPMVIDYRDPWYGNPYNEDRTHLFTRLSKSLENKILQKADRIIFNTRSLAELYQKNFFLKREKYTVIPNGYEGDPVSTTPFYPNKYNQMTIVHAGGLYGGRSPENFIQAVRNISNRLDTKIKIQFIGAGKATRNNIENNFKTDTNCEFEVTPRVSHKEVMEYLANADILLIFQQGTRVQIPRKLYEYMMFNKPILAVCEKGELSKILDECRIGRSVLDDIQNIETILMDMIKNPGCYTGNSNKIEKYSNKKLAMQFAVCFDAATGNPQ